MADGENTQQQNNKALSIDFLDNRLGEQVSHEELAKDIERVIKGKKLITRAWNTLSYPFRKLAITAEREKTKTLREKIVKVLARNSTFTERQYKHDLEKLLKKGCERQQYKANRNVIAISAVAFIIGLVFFPPLAIATVVVGMLCFFSDNPNRSIQRARENTINSMWQEGKKSREDAYKAEKKRLENLTKEPVKEESKEITQSELVSKLAQPASNGVTSVFHKAASAFISKKRKVIGNKSTQQATIRTSGIG